MEKLLTELLAKLDGGIILLDEELKISSWNHWLECETGVSSPLTRGRDIADVCRRFAEPFYRKILEKALKNSQSRFLAGRLHGALCEVNEHSNSGLHDVRVEPLQSGERRFILLQVSERTLEVRQNAMYAEKLESLQQRCEELEKMGFRQQGFFDPLTGLCSRAMLQERLKYVLAQAERGRQKLALIFLTLSGLDEISEVCGPEDRDKALCEAARRLECCVRSSDTLAHWKEGEFVLLLSHIRRTEDAAVVAENIMRAFKPLWKNEKKEFRLAANMGISIFPADGKCPEDLLDKAQNVQRKAMASYEFAEG